MVCTDAKCVSMPAAVRLGLGLMRAAKLSKTSINRAADAVDSSSLIRGCRLFSLIFFLQTLVYVKYLN